MMENTVTSYHADVIGYADYDYDDLVAWLDENKPGMENTSM